MKKTLVATILAFMTLALAGCGGGDGGSSAPATIVTNIISDPTFDGDIQKDPNTGAFAVTQRNTQSMFAGINPATGTESRAFLDFPLTGVNGVPANAVINSAILDVVINSLIPQPLFGTIPVRIDLVSFQPPNLIASDFDRTLLPAIATITIAPPISQADFGQHVTIDVTPLMVEAQRLGLTNFQVRIMEDFGIVSPGLIEINDTTGANRSILAPDLKVTYF